MTDTPHQNKLKNRQFETFEDRLVLSGQSIADFTIDPMLSQHNQPLEIEIQPMLADTNASSGVDYIHEQYGFTGEGQTVAVIDSGIAWDHYALGGGFGTGYKVVGGWDFAENDADPYDDGPAGFHGTHVAGIVGSTDQTHTGVASGVDLVGLRVFDDQGNGYFSWVEQALQWVHENRNEFENPITTVNLSLGTDWNSDSNPGWAMLEDEFTQLEADGIFISVSAGNSFQDYNTTGLSYPASSQYVVPVASHDANGEMSDFSQRNDRVIVAPGESIRSTVPDHLFGGTQTGQFLNASGTSMAAPYLAGASTLIREAFEFAGYEGITQDQIYDHIRQTADQIWDSHTNASYHKLNIANAIDSLIADLHGNSLATATNLGQLSDGDTITGTIGKLNDTDHFRFTAQENATVTLTIDTTHDLATQWNVSGASYQVNGNQVTFDVQAGQQYSFSLGTSDGLGHYEIDVDVQSTFNPTNWGTVAAKTFNNINVSGENWYQATAMRNGQFTVEALFAHNNGNVTLQIYDSSMNLLGTSASMTDNERLDVYANAGDRFYICCVGNNSDVDVKLTNLVGRTSGVLNIHGTNANDTITLNINNGYSFVVNGTSYFYGESSVESVRVLTHNGHDTVAITGTSANESAYMRGQYSRIANATQSVDVVGAEHVTFYSGGGMDRVSFIDTAGNDNMYMNQTSSVMTNSDFYHRAQGFTKTFVTATGGNDNAYMTGTSGNDNFYGRHDYSMMINGDRLYYAANFDNVSALGNGGFDRAYVHGSSGNDQLLLSTTYASMSGDGFQYSANGFRETRAFSNGGNDQVDFYDASTDDFFYSEYTSAFMRNGHFANYAYGFNQVVAHATNGGNDTAVISDSAQDDTFYAYSTHSLMVNSSWYQRVNGFEQVTALATNGGNDTAYLHGTSGNETVNSIGNRVTMVGSGFQYTANGFETIDTRGGGGVDQANVQGTSGVDYLVVQGLHAQLSGTGYNNHFRNFQDTQVDTGAGDDEALFYELGQYDQLCGDGNELEATVNQSHIRAWGFTWLEAFSRDNEVSNEEMGAVNYLFELHGQWE